MTSLTLDSTITCPECHRAKAERMPMDACQWFYDCEGCHALVRPKSGDCCVFCSYGTECPKSALGYDFDGATFRHTGDKVTFEVVAESFGLLGDAALQRLARLVHYIDVGGIPVNEAPGFEMLVRGLQARHADDDQLLVAALPVFDAYYAAMQAPDDK